MSLLQVVLAMPVVVHDRCARFRHCRKTVEVPQLHFLHGCGRRGDTQRRVPGCPGGASDSVIDGMLKCLGGAILTHFAAFFAIRSAGRAG